MKQNKLVAMVMWGLLLLTGCGGSVPGIVRAQGNFSNALDGNGNITSGNERRTEEGGFEFQFPVTGSYAVNADGTGTLTMRFDGRVDTWSIVLVAAGQKVKLVSIEPNNFLAGTILGEMEKQ